MTTYISRVLIANRGEIARRIIRSAHAMGISTVAIYADGDVNEPFVREAEVAIALDGVSSLDTYLNTEKVLAAAKRSGADAIHPGYGFLSENASFADKVKQAGLTWIGPDGNAILQMGDKLSAKRLMEKAKVPTLPSAEVKAGDDPDKLAETIGYPLLVKASAGGGGKGMRVVEAKKELAAAVEGARREAAAAFGDDTIFLERWLTKSRHVEIQVLGDQHGNVVHCFERECSIQRRHQKIIEEAPSPAVSDSLRKQMGEAAVAAAKAIGYSSAGTVEFLLAGEEFWFLEMNTRLQVEHPVTEAISGLDLVRQQLLIAQGQTLSFTQDDLTINGHAIEARLYAEDPANGFLPAAGKVLIWKPSSFADARFDSGIESGSNVGIDFDPMLAKIIVHAPTRTEAALRLARVLETTIVQGLTTNRDFLVAVLRTPEFLAGDTTTDFIDRVNPARSHQPRDADLGEAAMAASLLAQCKRHQQAKVLKSIPSGWRNTVMPPESVSYMHGDKQLNIAYQAQRDGSFRISAGELESRVVIQSWSENEISLTIDDRRMSCTVVADGTRWLVHGPGGQVELTELPRFPAAVHEGVSGGLTAPMPGNVLACYVKQGDLVEQGQLLLILEAMKMEHRITAPDAGVISEIRIQQGDQVANGELLIVLSQNEEN